MLKSNKNGGANKETMPICHTFYGIDYIVFSCLKLSVFRAHCVFSNKSYVAFHKE
jgi:hypothetical protein